MPWIFQGVVVCWGNNREGQLQVPDGRYRSIASGWRFTCGIHIDGNIQCWGSQYDGHLEPPLGDFSMLSAGESFRVRCRLEGQQFMLGSSEQQKSGNPTSTTIGIRQTLRGRRLSLRADRGRRPELLGFSGFRLNGLLVLVLPSG